MDNEDETALLTADNAFDDVQFDNLMHYDCDSSSLADDGGGVSGTQMSLERTDKSELKTHVGALIERNGRKARKMYASQTRDYATATRYDDKRCKTLAGCHVEKMRHEKSPKVAVKHDRDRSKVRINVSQAELERIETAESCCTGGKLSHITVEDVGSTRVSYKCALKRQATNNNSISDNENTELYRETRTQSKLSITSNVQQAECSMCRYQYVSRHKVIAAKTTKNFIGIVMSSIFWLASLSVLQCFQSTLNPRRTLGVVSMVTMHATAVVSCFSAPTVVRHLSSRWTLVIGYIAQVIYVISNFHPSGILLLPGALIAGSMTGPIWAAQSRILTSLADIDRANGQDTVSKSGSTSAYQINHLEGLFNGFSQNGPIWGNLVAALIFITDNETVQLFEPSDVETSEWHRSRTQRSTCTDEMTPSRAKNRSSSQPTNVRSISRLSSFRVQCSNSGRRCCGADAEINEADDDNDDDVVRVPHHFAELPPVVRRWLLAVNTGLATSAVLLSVLLIDHEGKLNESVVRSMTPPRRWRHVPDYAECSQTSHCQHSRLESIDSSKSYLSASSNLLPAPFSVRSRFVPTPMVSYRQWMIALKNVLKDPHTQLLAPLVCFCGFSQGFIYVDFTKLYVNCAIGIHQIGFVIAVYFTASTLASIAINHATSAVRSTHHSGRIRGTHVVAAGIVFNAGMLIVLARWHPWHDDRAMFYAVATCLGLCDAVWTTQTRALFRSLFADKLNVASTCHSLFQTLGLVASLVCSSNIALGVQPTTSRISINGTDTSASVTGASSASPLVTHSRTWPPSVATKIYIQAVLLAASVVLYAAAEYTLPLRSRPLTAVRSSDKLQRRVVVEIATSSFTTKQQPHRIMSVDNINMIVLSPTDGMTNYHRQQHAHPRPCRIDV